MLPNKPGMLMKNILIVDVGEWLKARSEKKLLFIEF